MFAIAIERRTSWAVYHLSASCFAVLILDLVPVLVLGLWCSLVLVANSRGSAGLLQGLFVCLSNNVLTTIRVCDVK